MQQLTTENIQLAGRQFSLFTYRDIDKDSLVIEVEELGHHKQDMSHLKSYVAMKGNLDLPPHQYEGYEDAVKALKDLLKQEVQRS